MTTERKDGAGGQEIRMDGWRGGRSKGGVRGKDVKIWMMKCRGGGPCAVQRETARWTMGGRRRAVRKVEAADMFMVQ